MTEQDTSLSSEEHARIFRDVVLREAEFESKASHERPRAIILGGQPGAGKGSLVRAARDELNKDVVVIDPDAMREFHPAVDAFRHESPYTWSGKTHADAGKWADELLQATASSKKNLIFDTTLSNGEWASNELIKGLQEKGYSVEVRAIVTSKLESELGVDARFSKSLDIAGYGRHVPAGARDAIYQKLPTSLDIIHERTDVPIRLFSREGVELYDSRTDSRLPSTALQEARDARLRDPAVTRNLSEDWRDQQAWHKNLPEATRENSRIDALTRDRLLSERISEGVVERVNSTAQEAFDIDHATRIRPARISAASRLGVVGLALDVYDGAETARTVGRLRGEGNNTAADSQLVHFGSRTVGGFGGAAIGASAGGLVTSWSGPGMLIGGAAGGVVGAFGGEKFAVWTDNRRIYNQQDRSGNTWTHDPEQPGLGWQRQAPLDATNDGIDNVRRGNLRASPAMANMLNYQATSISVELILGSPPPQRDPFSQPANEHDAKGYDGGNWRRDMDKGQWTRIVYDGYVDEYGTRAGSVHTAPPERAEQLDRAAAQVVLDNASNSPASIAAKFEDGYIRNSWVAHGPMPEAVRSARTDIDTLVASDENRYQRQADGSWLSKGSIYNSTANGRLHEELEATRSVLQERLPPPREIVAPASMTAEDRLRDAVAGAYINAGVEVGPSKIAASANAVQATWRANNLDPETTAINLGRDVAGRYSADSPINSMRLEEDGRTYRIEATTSIEQIRAVEEVPRQASEARVPLEFQAPRGASASGGTQHAVNELQPGVPRHAPLADNPAHADFASYNRIHQWVSGTGQWDEEKGRNVASALYREQLAQPSVRRVDKVAGALGPDGAENVFAIYAPHGDKGPFFRACVDGREACLQPAEQNLQQAEQIRQELAERELAQQQEQVQESQRKSAMSRE